MRRLPLPSLKLEYSIIVWKPKKVKEWGFYYDSNIFRQFRQEVSVWTFQTALTHVCLTQIPSFVGLWTIKYALIFWVIFIYLRTPCSQIEKGRLEMVTWITVYAMLEERPRLFHAVTGTYMSSQPCSPIMSMALRCSPADRYISAAARGSLLLLAQSACLVIRIRELLGSVPPMKSCKISTHVFYKITNLLTK